LDPFVFFEYYILTVSDVFILETPTSQNDFCYQLAFLIPGIFPSLANSRKQIRHKPKSLIKACPRPHLKQRFVALVENFGFFVARALTDVLAMK
jgi:hypothetical protein